jgi:glutamyl-tRNA reductase
LIQELNFQADTWRQAEVLRARKLLDKGQSIESVLESLSVGMMKKMLNGPLRELNHTEELQRVKARDAVKQMFLKL